MSIYRLLLRAHPDGSKPPFFDRAVYRLRALAVSTFVTRPRTMFWRLLGMQVGSGTLLPRIHVTWPHHVSLGRHCTIEHGVFLKFDGIWAPGPTILIGDDSFIGAGCQFNVHCRISVGRHALIASGCVLVDHDHGFASRDIPMMQQHSERESPIVIEDDVWIGANSVITKGVTIGRGAIVGACSVVTKSVGPYEIWGGVPAKFIRMRPGARSNATR